MQDMRQKQLEEEPEKARQKPEPGKAEQTAKQESQAKKVLRNVFIIVIMAAFILFFIMAFLNRR